MTGHEPDVTYHVAVTVSGAVTDRSYGGGHLDLEEAQAEMQDIRKHTPDTRLTVFRIAVEVVQS